MKFNELLSEVRNNTLLLEKDHRKKITDKIGFSQDIADWLHQLNDKYSIWFAQQLEKAGYKQATLAEIRDTFELTFHNIVHWIIGRAELGRHVIIKQYDLQTAAREAEAWHEEIQNASEEDTEDAKDTSDKEKSVGLSGVDEPDLATGGEIIMKFPDGFYWIDLHKSHCSREAKRMQHCGRSYQSGNTLLSLRSGTEGTPGVTIEIATTFKNYNQAKGKQNKIPNEKYYPYIVALFEKIGVPKYSKSGGSDWTILALDIDDANYLLQNSKRADEWNEHLVDIAEKTKIDISSKGYKLNDAAKRWLEDEEYRIHTKIKEVLHANGINIDVSKKMNYDKDNFDITAIVNWVTDIIKSDGFDKFIQEEPDQVGFWYEVDREYYDYIKPGSHVAGLVLDELVDDILVVGVYWNLAEQQEFKTKVATPGVITGQDILNALYKLRGK